MVNALFFFRDTYILTRTKAVDIMPTLLSAFVISFRKKRDIRSEMMQSNDRKVEIGMFMYMLKIYSSMEQDEPSVYLKSLSQLLEKVVHEGLYAAQIEQDNLLLELSSKMIGYIHSSTGKLTYKQECVKGINNHNRKSSKLYI
jgi:hypothetical protein